ncbi:MAG: galactose oxidase early set domain-containing protein, partial [Acidimicrobiia bacterium]
TQAPAGIAYGERFTLRTPDAAGIEAVTLLRTPSPQHVMDPDQRGLTLSFTRTGADRLEVTAPPDGIAAPPGDYYLVINKEVPAGPVPSVARIVRISTGSDPAEAIQPLPDDAPAPSGGSATPDEDTSAVNRAQAAVVPAAGSPVRATGRRARK